MGRPPTQLSDEEARQLVAGIVELEQLYPLNPRDHRLFVSAFIRLVHRVTNRTFSPMVYRRLLGAFAPGRAPSTNTIALEKSRFVDELSRLQLGRAVAGEAGFPATVPSLSLDLAALQASVSRLLQQRTSYRDNYLQQQCEFLQQRLSTTERELVDNKVLAGRLSAELAAAQTQADRDRQEVDRLRSDAAAQTKEIARLATIVEDARRFAMLAIEEARGETRAWKERCQHAEGQIKEQIATTEMFRRMAYQRGA